MPLKLIEEVAAASDQHGNLVGMPFDSNRAREAIAFAAAFEPVATKAEAFAQRVRDAIIIAKGDVGSAALAVYASMKGVVRRPEGAALRDSFHKMTQIMKDRRKQNTTAEKKREKRAKASPHAQPAPHPATPAAPADASPPANDVVKPPSKSTNGTTVVINPQAVA